MWSGRVVPGLRTLATLSDGPDQMRKNVRESFRGGAEFLKLCVTGGVISKHDKLTDTQFSSEEIAVAVAEATARGTYVTVHAHNVEGIRNAVLAGVRGVEHGTGHRRGDRRADGRAPGHPRADAHRGRGAHHGTSTGSACPASSPSEATRVREAMIDGLLAAKAAGVRVALGSDVIGPDQSRRGEELTLRAAVESPMEALIAATRVNADLLGLESEIGTLEVGKQADIVAFAGNPLEDPALFAEPDSVVLVLQNGVVVEGRTNGLTPSPSGSAADRLHHAHKVRTEHLGDVLVRPAARDQTAGDVREVPIVVEPDQSAASRPSRPRAGSRSRRRSAGGRRSSIHSGSCKRPVGADGDVVYAGHLGDVLDVVEHRVDGDG